VVSSPTTDACLDASTQLLSRRLLIARIRLKEDRCPFLSSCLPDLSCSWFLTSGTIRFAISAKGRPSQRYGGIAAVSLESAQVRLADSSPPSFQCLLIPIHFSIAILDRGSDSAAASQRRRRRDRGVDRSV
jgi:hypothetical protein